MTIPVSHTLDAVCAAVGEIDTLAAVLAKRRTTTTLISTGEALALTAQDQVAFSATLKTGAILNVHYRGGMAKGTNMLLEINGTQGDLRLTGPGGHAQIFDLTLSGGNGEQQTLETLTVPAEYYHTKLTSGPAANVAEVYAQLANDIREGTQLCPDFEHAVLRHRMIEAIEQSAATGVRQPV